MHRLHLKNGGATPKEILEEKRRYLLTRPINRPAQKYQDFSSPTPTERKPKPHQYIAMIGLRADEQTRVRRIFERTSNANEAVDYEGEHAYMPLEDIGIQREDVNKFWQQQPFDLELPASGILSNCVYCFLKGTGNIIAARAHIEKEQDDIAGTPSDIAWWKRLEETYGRDNLREGRTIRNPETGQFVGFFGTGSKNSYASLAKADTSNAEPHPAQLLPCDCTE